jgi:hypothetical protein
MVMHHLTRQPDTRYLRLTKPSAFITGQTVAVDGGFSIV